MIVRNGRTLRGFALGAADPYAQSASDLADLQAAVTQGDMRIAAGDYGGAVQIYQTTGANAASVLGPEIDAAGAPQATQSLTAHAQMLADKLAVPISSPATVTDATNARLLIGPMLDDYLDAIRAGRAAQNVGPDKHLVWPLITIPLGIAGIIAGARRMRKHTKARHR